MTYLWQEEIRRKFYHVQTDEKPVAEKLKRRKKFKLAMIGENCDLWIYSCEFNRLEDARKTIKSVTGKNWKIDSEGIIIYG